MKCVNKCLLTPIQHQQKSPIWGVLKQNKDLYSVQKKLDCDKNKTVNAAC